MTLIALSLGLCFPREARSQVQLDTVKVTPALRAAMELGEARDYCAPFKAWRRYPDRYAVYFDSLHPAEMRLGTAECSPREATVLVRPMFAFTIVDFVFLRPRAHYVALISPPYAVGIPLGRLPGVQSTFPADGTSVHEARESDSLPITAGGDLGRRTVRETPQSLAQTYGRLKEPPGSWEDAWLTGDAGSSPARGYFGGSFRNPRTPATAGDTGRPRPLDQLAR
jgi:hypothetical protein